MNSGALLILGVGIFLLIALVFNWMQYRLRLRMRREASDGGLAKYLSYDWRVWAIFIFTIILTLLYARPIDRPVVGATQQVDEFTGEVLPTESHTAHAYVVALYVFVVGMYWGIRQARKVQVSEREIINLQVGELVHSFRSVFRIRPTVFSALEEANKKIQPPVGSAISHAVTTFYVTSLPRRALDELRSRIQNPYLEQFLYILERGEDAKHEDIMIALDGLLLRLRRAREIRDQSEVNMTVITGQTKLIQMIAVTLVTIVAIIPMFRNAYEGAIGQMVFMVLATVGVLTSFYIDRQAGALKEKVL